jgi:hypothetical protein
MTNTTATHRVAWAIEYGQVSAKFACSAPEDAPCRTYCMDSTCDDEVCTDPANHRRSGQPCMVITWLTESGAPEELYGGEPAKPLDAPINYEWTGDDYHWSYVEPVTVVAP